MIFLTFYLTHELKGLERKKKSKSFCRTKRRLSSTCYFYYTIMKLDKIVYCLYCPDKKIPVYIGKSTSGINRPWQHIIEKSHSTKVNDWVHYLETINEKPVIVVLDTATDDSILIAKESFWIQKYYSDGYPLLNLQGLTAGYFIITGNYDKDNYLRYIRSYIILKRKGMKMSQKDLSLKAGVGLRFVRDFEQGKKDNYSTKSIQMLLNLFGGIITINNIRDLE